MSDEIVIQIEENIAGIEITIDKTSAPILDIKERAQNIILDIHNVTESVIIEGS